MFGRNSKRRQDDHNRPGSLTVDTSGHPSMSLGGGLGVDLTNGDPTLNLGGGISVDIGPNAGDC